MPAPPPSSLTYKDAGVDTAAGDSLLDRLRHLYQRTHSTRVLANLQTAGTAGLFRLDYHEKLFQRHYKDPVLISCANGVGTKLKIAAALQQYATVGIDLVALNVNDLVVQGGEPLFFLHHLALHRLDPAITTALVQGLSDGCVRAGFALLGGETAEMPALYAPGEFDMAGFAVGIVEKNKMLDPADIQAGDSVIGLASSGLHANGYALVRRVLEKSGAALTDFIPELNGTLAEELLRPTRIYAQTVQKLLARYKVKKIVKAMAHISGGGLGGLATAPGENGSATGGGGAGGGGGGNLPRILPEGFAARLKRDAWTPPPIFTWLQKTGPVDLEEMFHVFNMGIGYILIVRPTFTRPILSALRALHEKPSFLGKIRKLNATSEPRLEWS